MEIRSGGKRKRTIKRETEAIKNVGWNASEVEVMENKVEIAEQIAIEIVALEKQAEIHKWWALKGCIAIAPIHKKHRW
jgi:hypothetical protein